MSVTSIRLNPEVEAALREIAEKQNRSRNWLINQAIREFLDKQQLEEEQWTETLQAVDSLNRGAVVEGGTVHKWVESWGTEDEKPKPHS